jgi:hypothetical protein
MEAAFTCQGKEGIVEARPRAATLSTAGAPRPTCERDGGTEYSTESDLMADTTAAKTQYYTAATLDGFIADPDLSLDWLFQFGVQETEEFPAFLRDVGAVAMGSWTCEWILKHLIDAPLLEYTAALMPIAHTLLQARVDLERVPPEVTAEELWRRPGSAASAAGAHARGHAWCFGIEARRGRVGADRQGARPAATHTGRKPRSAREVGRAQLPSTVLGLLFHPAEHTSRHVGRLITALKVVRGSAVAQA